MTNQQLHTILEIIKSATATEIKALEEHLYLVRRQIERLEDERIKSLLRAKGE